jgi:hypothetical protein
MKEYALKCSRLDFNHAPKKTWDIAFEIIKGFLGHFKKSTLKQFKDTKGKTKPLTLLTGMSCSKY